MDEKHTIVHLELMLLRYDLKIRDFCKLTGMYL